MHLCLSSVGEGNSLKTETSFMLSYVFESSAVWADCSGREAVSCWLSCRNPRGVFGFTVAACAGSIIIDWFALIITTKQKLQKKQSSVIELWFLAWKTTAVSTTLLLHRRECLLSNLVHQERRDAPLKASSTQQTQRPLQFACKAAGSVLSFMKQTSSLPIRMAPKLTWPKSGCKDFLLKALDWLCSVKSSRRRRPRHHHHHHHRLSWSLVYVSQDNSYSGPGWFKGKCWSAYTTCLSFFLRVFWTEKELGMSTCTSLDLFVLNSGRALFG